MGTVMRLAKVMVVVVTSVFIYRQIQARVGFLPQV